MRSYIWRPMATPFSQAVKANPSFSQALIAALKVIMFASPVIKGTVCSIESDHRSFKTRYYKEGVECSPFAGIDHDSRTDRTLVCAGGINDAYRRGDRLPLVRRLGGLPVGSAGRLSPFAESRARAASGCSSSSSSLSSASASI